MTAAKTVTATFSTAANVRAGAQEYGSFQSAYSAVPDGGIFLMKDIIFPEAVLITPVNPAATFTIKGGYADFAAPAAGYSTIKGTLKIRSGKVIAERIRVAP